MLALLFLDDYWVQHSQQVTRVWHQPALVAESRMAVGPNRWGCSFPGVCYDPAREVYRLWYLALLTREGKETWPLLYGESQDGWHFSPVAVPRDRLHSESPLRSGGDWPNNAVFLTHALGHSNYCADVVSEPDCPDPQRRFQMVYGSSPAGWSPGEWFNALAFSPDGFRWTPHPELKVHPEYSDTCHLLRFNARDKQYQIICRPGPANRQVAMVRSPDLRTWSIPRLLFSADDQDPKAIQFYAMPAFVYSGTWVGLLWTMRTPPERAGAATGEMDVQLTWSHDGVQWTRGPRQAFIPLRKEGQYGHGAVEASSLLVDPDGDLRLYANGFLVDHAVLRESMARGTPPSEMLAYRLRRDGFVGLRTGVSGGSVVLRPVVMGRQGLVLNASVESLRVELRDDTGKPLPGYAFSDCQPIHGDERAARVSWRGHRDAHDLAGRKVCIAVAWSDGELLSVRGVERSEEE